MKLPKLTDTKSSREFIDVFRGYNHNLRIGDGEFYDMKNLSSDKYPVLSTRRRRGMCDTQENPLGIIAKDIICYVDGSEFVMGAVRKDIGLDPSSKKTLVSMGAYVIIFPDNKYINTADLDDYGDLGKFTVTAKCSLCDLDGGEGDYTISATEPELKKLVLSGVTKYYFSGTWIDTSVTPYVAKRYSSADQAWVETSTSFIRVDVAGIGEYYSRLDHLGDDDLKSDTIFLKYNFVHKAEPDYIVLCGVMGEEETVEMTIEKEIPKFDFVIESGNRLWGCRYGSKLTPSGNTLEGTVINEIYASALGNFNVWDRYKGVSTDPYTASVGSNGGFTGAITYGGHPIFFKSNCMHVVYGEYPSNYHIETIECPGVQAGCEKSLAIVNGVLYYKSSIGIFAYDGSYPVNVSEALGSVQYHNAAAGGFDGKYYVSMNDNNGDYSLFVYDTAKGMWHKEDDVQAIDFAALDDMYFVDYHDKQIKSVNGSGINALTETVSEAGTIKWIAETGIIGIDSPDKKYVSRIDVRLSLEVGAVARIWVQYDSSGEWELLCTLKGTSLRSFAAPIRPKRCDHLRLRFEGEGDVKIFSICKTIEEGSDV